MAEYVAAVDQGTTGTRCMVFDRGGRVMGAHYVEHRQIFPRPGWVEHDPHEIWQNTRRAIDAAFAAGGVPAREIAALGIANQRETTLVWNRRTGEPYYPAVVWQCTRSEEICKRLLTDGLEPLIRERTGLLAATYFSGPKLAWLLENVPGLREDAERGEALFGTVDSWLIWNLTGGPAGGAHVTDVTNASRTMLMDLRRRQWDEEMLGILRIPSAMLPEIRPSSDARPYGASRPEDTGGVALPVCGVLGDQQAALVGQCCFRPGEAKNTYGTGSFLLMHTGDAPVASEAGLLSTTAYQLGADGECQYALEGSIAITGAAVQWLRDNLGILSSAAESEAVAGSVEDAGGVYMVPAFSGLYAPHWDMDARGIIAGLTRYTTRAHLVRATLEAICYQAREVLEAMEADSGIRLQALKVDGGAVANDLLMQMQADILGTPVVRPTLQETTALGAAYAAGLAAGVWSGLDDLRANWGIDRTFEPSWDDERRARGYRGWQRAVERAKGWVE
ncbi:MAG: glycerol kinase GlpK [Chloroflexi bacterium]|nr:glycerol kinase GlpK [Chloroflexota bacterium]